MRRIKSSGTTNQFVTMIGLFGIFVQKERGMVKSRSAEYVGEDRRA